MHDHQVDKVREKRRLRHPARRKRRVVLLIACSGIIGLGVAWAAWLASTATNIQRELNAATALLPSLKQEIAAGDRTSANSTVEKLRDHTGSAAEVASYPLWTVGKALPGIGVNFSAVSEITRSADDVANLGLVPLVRVVGSMNWDTLLPTGSGTDLEPLKAASPSVTGAARAVDMSANRLNQIDATKLVPQIAEPLNKAKLQLAEVTETLNSAAVAAQVLPDMLGSETPRNYLLMIQNNAEARSSGGIPGALAVLKIDKGKLSLSAQGTAGDVGVMAPPVQVDRQTQQIYTDRAGKYMQDVNLTPDFPTAALTAQAMWERKTGQRVDGVVSIDPVALSYILQATGPVTMKGLGEGTLQSSGLPKELNGQNVVPTLLSDVYAKIEQPQLQDAYFAGAAQEIFGALSSGLADPKGLISGITRAADEARVLVWSGLASEQALISKYPLGGSVSGPSVAPAQFGVYFNDGTGAKMDYYVKRTVQLIKECPRGGYEQITVRVTSTNTAPLDAASTLPEYVTGGGVFGVPAGSVETNIVAYGPVQAVVETAKLDGQETGFAPYLHSNRPVGVMALRLAPGESRTTDFTFGKIVQHTEPNVVVTPSVQDIKDVTLPTQVALCD